MKLLYLTTPEEDYLQDNMLYGLRMILGSNLVDYPKKEVLYRSCPKALSDLYGRGFTAWKLLDDIDIDRADIDRRITKREFDVVIFGSIQRQKSVVRDYIRAWRLFLPGYRFAFLDGEDGARINWGMLPWGPYYKRERGAITQVFTRGIHFSIPGQKVRIQPLEKTRLFAKHVQCEEAYKIDWVRRDCSKTYAFTDEASYYENLARSKYAVTMKKSGWDCMRHYEIAANATVMAFYNLHQKPVSCAPHGLVDMVNVVAFSTADELMCKIGHIEKQGLYAKLQKNSIQWAWDNTCERTALEFLKGL